MDSTPSPTQPHHSFSIKAAARKLPIKRKTPDNPNPNPNLVPKLEPTTTITDDGDGDDFDDEIDGSDQKPPPFKFHRIWTEPDEIRFLQGLLDCSTQGLAFPRDLHVFYTRFSETMSQPYTKSQLSEKLRRLRKKFRVISARLARGLDVSLLSPHDRALFELSKKLWHPEFDSASPFSKSAVNNNTIDNNKKKGNSSISSHLVGVKVSFSPTLPLNHSSDSHPTHSSNDHNNDFGFIDIDNEYNDYECDDDNGDDGDIRMSEVKVDYDFGGVGGGGGGGGGGGVGGGEEMWSWRSIGDGGLRRVAANTVIDVFDQSLKEVRMVLVRQGLLYPDNKLNPAASSMGKAVDFEKRWQEQRVAELDVLARRLRLVLENSLHGQ